MFQYSEAKQLKQGRSDPNSEVIILVGINVLYFIVIEINWDCPRVTIMNRRLYY